MQLTDGSAIPISIGAIKFCSSFDVSETFVVCKEEVRVDVFIIGAGLKGF